MNSIEQEKNPEKCPSFEKCSRNFCPLDFELNLRSGREQDKCRYMRSPRRTKVKDKEFITGGGIMPDAILDLVPERNLETLNEVSRERFREIRNSTTQ